MVTLNYDLTDASEKFGLTKDEIINKLIGAGYKQEDIPLEGPLPDEMLKPLHPDQEQLLFQKIQGPKIIGKIDLDRIEVEQVIKEIRRKGLTRLDLRRFDVRQIPEIVLEVKNQVTEIMLGGPMAAPAKGPNKDILNIQILENFKLLNKLVIRNTGFGGIQNLPHMPDLQELELVNCGLFDIGDPRKFKNVRLLNLNRNFLSGHNCEDLENLTSLEDLSLSYNRIMDIGFLEKRIPDSLKALRLSFNSDYSDSLHFFSELGKLEILDLSGSNLRNIEPILRLSSLRELYLRKNKIRVMRSKLGLRYLEKLDLSSNSLNSCVFLSGCKNLRWLDLERNAISDLSPLSELSGLRHLALANNQINDIAPLSEMQELRFLDLGSNKIEDLTPLRKILSREAPRLDVRSTRRLLFRMNPTGLLLDDNPIKNPPRQYISAGREAILQYFMDQQDGKGKVEKKRTVNEAKLIIVGNSGAGKSTLSFLLRNRKLPQASLASTHGLEFSTWKPEWKVNSKTLSINIIDFGGQEYYHDTHHLFFNDRTAYLLVWDPATNINGELVVESGERSRPEYVRHFPIEYWLNAIEIYSSVTRQYVGDDVEAELQSLVIDGIDDFSDATEVAEAFSKMTDPIRLNIAPVLLVQTHADKKGTQFLNLSDLKRKYGSLFGSVSVGMNVRASHSEGIGVLDLMLERLYASMTGSAGLMYPSSWVSIRNYIEKNEKDTFKIMNVEEFREYFRNHTSPSQNYSPERIRSLCITLDYWGVVLYRFDKIELRDTIIINPQFFIQNLNSLFSDKIRQRNGIVFMHEVTELLQMEAAKAAAFLKILTTFKILFELPQKGTGSETGFIAPMYLGERPGYVDMLLTNFVAFYKFKYEAYYHKGILLDCFSRLGKDIYFEQGFYFHWQWGMVLKRGERVICIEFDKNNLNQIYIKLNRNGSERVGEDPFLLEVLNKFHIINENYETSLELSLEGENFVPKRHLLNELEKGIARFEWNGKLFDSRLFSFLLRGDEPSSPYRRVFVSYSSKDRAYLDRLASHLLLYKKAGFITFWDDLMFHPREQWDEQIKEQMNKANILIMLLSPDYLGTDYILQEEIPLAVHSLESSDSHKRVFWIQLRPCNFELFPNIARYPIFPLKEKDLASGSARQLALSEYPDQDREWVKLLRMMLSDND